MNLGRTLTGLLLLALLPFASGCGGDDDDDDAGNPWVGNTYSYTAPETRWAQPPGMGADLVEYMPAAILIQVDASSGDTVDVTLGTADANGAQDTCNLTTTATAQPATYPEVTIGPVDFPFHIALDDPQNPGQMVVADVVAYSFTVTNVLPDGDTPAEDGSMTAFLDVREMDPLFTGLGENRTPDTICTTINDSTEAACQACPHGGDYCLFAEALRLGATPVSVPLQPVASIDASCPQ